MKTPPPKKRPSFFRKALKIGLVTALLVGTVIALAPKILDVGKIQTRIIQRLSTRLQCAIQVEDMEWHWLPFPRLELKNIRAEKQNLRLFLPRTTISPHFNLLTGLDEESTRIHLQSPQIQLILTGPTPTTGPEISLPRGKISISNGRVSLEAPNYPALFTKDAPLTFSSISGEINTLPQQVVFDVKAATPFCQQGEFSGKFIPTSNSYDLAFQLWQINLREIFIFKEGAPIIADDSRLNLSGTIKGSGTKTINATVVGDLPCITVQPAGDKTIIDCGVAEVQFTKTAQNLEVNIKELELTNPPLKLSGSISRENRTGQAPVWDLNLRAVDLDMASIRRKILKAFPNSDTATTVSSIVLGGTAEWAAYRFHGPTENFEHLQNMEIRVGGIKAPINVPHVDLPLTDATGEISIIDGYLSGKGLRANLKNSRGSNCDLYLDLLERDHAFLLDLDIDADLTELPWALHKVVNFTAFTEELDKFNRISGRAQGHLSLGKTLRHIETRVQVNAMQTTFSYSPLTLPTTVFGGKLDIAPDEVRWTEIRAKNGEQEVQSCSGSVNWAELTKLKIDNLQAVLEVNSGIGELRSHQALPTWFDKAISNAVGRIAIDNLRLHGPPQQPASWEYELKYSMQGLKVNGPELPNTMILIEKSQGLLTDKTATIGVSKIWLQEQPFQLQGNLSHSRFNNWQGNLEVSGLVRKDLSNWIADQRWIPEALFPAIPCRLDGLNLEWGEGHTHLSGKIYGGTDKTLSPYVELELTAAPSSLLVTRASFHSRGKQADLSLQIDRRHPAEKFAFSWQGELEGSTLNSLLKKNDFLAGRLSGSMTTEFLEQPETSKIEGSLQATGLSLPISTDKKLTITQGSITASGRELTIDSIKFYLNNDELALSGTMTATPDGVVMALGLFGNRLSWENLTNHLQERDQADMNGFAPEAQPPPLPPLSWDFLGTCGFTLNDLSLTRQRPLTDLKADNPPQIFNWSPVTGQVEFHPGKGFSLRVTEAELCKLKMSGAWHSSQAFGKNTLLVETLPQSPPLFQEVLPCLGMQNDLIVGPFNLHVQMQNEAGQWTIGKAELNSPGGYIKRLNLLAKVFSVLNVTDLFKETGLGELHQDGFAYSSLDIKTVIKNDTLITKRAVIKGEGLNLFAEGNVDLKTFNSDLTLLIAPFKTIDTLITSVPLIGKAVGGANKALITIPVGISNKIYDPTVTVLPAKAVGKSLLNIVANTLSLPFAILNPAESDPDP